MKWQTCYYDAALRRMWRTIRRCDHRFISLVSIIIPGYVTVKMAQYSATRAEARAKKLFPHSAAISHLFSPLIQSFIILPLFAACCRLLLEERRTTARGLNHSENLQRERQFRREKGYLRCSRSVVDDDATECKHKCKTVMFGRNKVFRNGVF